jgi:hypothetical protein
VDSPVVIGVFDDPVGLVGAARAARAERLRIHDAFTPHPVEGLDEAMGIRRTLLPWVTLVAGASAAGLAVLFQLYAAAWDWPLDVGGKPDASFLAFVPIAFELSVLAAALSTALALLVRARLHPGRREWLPDPGVTDDAFALTFRRRDKLFDAGRVREVLLAAGAREVRIVEAQP